jgi:uncharacterized protein (TIGR02679 family)
VIAASTEYLESPAFSRLWTAAREAWERNGGLTGNAVLNDLTEAEAIEISGLLGRRRPLRAHTTARVKLTELDEALCGFATPLEKWLAETSGRLVDRRHERAQAEAARAELWDEVEARAVAVRADLVSVVSDLRRTGLARRLAGDNERLLLRQTLDVLETILRLDRAVDIAVLAAQRLGDAKALNAGSAVGTLVLRALAVIDGGSPPADEEARRELWEHHLVVCDSLSSTVLTLNLRLDTDDALGRSLNVSADAGEPRVLTLRELSRARGIFANRRVYICENPTVVSAAAEQTIQPEFALVCVEGWPSVAAHRLLRLAKDSGAELLYHGDFDWHGLRIADSILAAYGAQPWRMSSADYLEAVSSTTRSRRLTGEHHHASWDPQLSSAMAAEDTVVEEEGAVLALLLEDIGGH